MHSLGDRCRRLLLGARAPLTAPLHAPSTFPAHVRRTLALLACATLLGCGARREMRPTPAPAPASMEEAVRPSLRGDDEVARPPAPRPPQTPPPSRQAARRRFSWTDENGERVYYGFPKRSSSVGRPTGGRLRDGRALPAEGSGFWHQGERPFGTDELVAVLHWAFDRVLRQFPGTPRVLVRDLSGESGGRARPHRSHQSGRDADVGYYLRHAPSERGGSFPEATPASLDAERTWALFEALLATGLVQYLFVDYELQGPLYEEARRAGWTETSLAEIFQYPAPRSDRTGIIRHERGHDDHFHLRIHCPEGDQRCGD